MNDFPLGPLLHCLGVILLTLAFHFVPMLFGVQVSWMWAAIGAGMLWFGGVLLVVLDV